MAYFTQSDVESWTGFSSTDFKNAGTTMTATQWAAFATSLVNQVTQMVNRFCNVTSLEWHVATEYKSGKGATGDDNLYNESDRIFDLIEYATGYISVSVDTATKGATIQFATRYERSTATAGDFEFWTDRELSWVRFHNNVPEAGYKNVKIEYYGGFATGSNQLYEINQICLRIAANILTYKKKIQESMTIRNTGIRDYAEMFKPIDERIVLTDDIQRDLHKYRRYVLGGDTWE